MQDDARYSNHSTLTICISGCQLYMADLAANDLVQLACLLIRSLFNSRVQSLNFPLD